MNSVNGYVKRFCQRPVIDTPFDIRESENWAVGQVDPTPNRTKFPIF